MKEAKLLDIINLIRSKKGLQNLAGLQPEFSLRDDFGFDSLDLAELTVRIEDEFGVDIFRERIVRTVDEILMQLN